MKTIIPLRTVLISVYCLFNIFSFNAPATIQLFKGGFPNVNFGIQNGNHPAPPLYIQNVSESGTKPHNHNQFWSQFTNTRGKRLIKSFDVKCMNVATHVLQTKQNATSTRRRKRTRGCQSLPNNHPNSLNLTSSDMGSEVGSPLRFRKMSGIQNFQSRLNKSDAFKLPRDKRQRQLVKARQLKPVKYIKYIKHIKPASRNNSREHRGNGRHSKMEKKSKKLFLGKHELMSDAKIQLDKKNGKFYNKRRKEDIHEQKVDHIRVKRESSGDMIQIIPKEGSDKVSLNEVVVVLTHYNGTTSTAATEDDVEFDLISGTKSSMTMTPSISKYEIFLKSNNILSPREKSQQSFQTMEESKSRSKNTGRFPDIRSGTTSESPRLLLEQKRNLSGGVILLEKFPVNLWRTLGLFDDSYMERINHHWLEFEPPSPMTHKVLATFYGFFMIVGCGGNLLVIIMFCRCRSLRTPPNYLLMNLAVSDFLMMAKTPIFIINSLYHGPVLGALGCKVYGFLGGLTGTASIMTLASIALDRYYVIVHPLNPFKRTTSRRALCMVLCVWLYAAIFSSLPLYWVNNYTSEGYLTSCSFDYLTDDFGGRLFIFIFFVAAWLVPLIIISFSYLNIFRIVREAGRMEVFCLGKEKNSGESFKFRPDQGKQKSEVRIALLAAVLISLWLLAWTPYALVALLGIFGWKQYLTPLISSIPALFCKTASCIDPFLYSLNHPKFKRELQFKFKLCFCYHLKKRNVREGSYYSGETCRGEEIENENENMTHQNETGSLRSVDKMIGALVPVGSLTYKSKPLFPNKGCKIRLSSSTDSIRSNNQTIQTGARTEDPYGRHHISNFDKQTETGRKISTISQKVNNGRRRSDLYNQGISFEGPATKNERDRYRSDESIQSYILKNVENKIQNNA